MSVLSNTVNAINSTTKPVLVEVYAPWCPHCQAEMPLIDQLRKEVGSKAEIIQVDGDANEDVMSHFHVHSYPTFMLFKDGQECWRDSGEKPVSELKDMIDRFI